MENQNANKILKILAEDHNIIFNSYNDFILEKDVPIQEKDSLVN